MSANSGISTSSVFAQFTTNASRQEKKSSRKGKTVKNVSEPAPVGVASPSAPVAPGNIDPNLLAAVAATIQSMQGFTVGVPEPVAVGAAAPKAAKKGGKKASKKAAKKAAPTTAVQQGQLTLVVEPYFHANEHESRLAILAPVNPRSGKPLVPSHLLEVGRKGDKVVTLEKFRRFSPWYLNVRSIVTVGKVVALGGREIENVTVNEQDAKAAAAKLLASL